MASNLETAKKGYELFQRGDVPTLIRDLVDDNCTWISAGPKDKLPWAGSFKGKQEIGNVFTKVAENWDFTEFAPRDFIEKGDTVVAIGTSSGVAKKTGKTVKNEWVHVLKYITGNWCSFRNTLTLRRRFLDCRNGLLPQVGSGNPRPPEPGIAGRRF